MKRLVKNITEWWSRKRPLKKLRNISIGWLRAFNILKTPIYIKVISIERLSVCSGCPSSRTSTLLKIINGKVRHESSLVCTECSCPCLEKSLVLEETCPLKKWFI